MADFTTELLTNLVVDYSKNIRVHLLGSILFPRVKVIKPEGTYAKFSKKDAHTTQDDTLADGAESNKLIHGGTKETYSTVPRGLHKWIDNRELRHMDGPFKAEEKKAVKKLTTKLELNQEKRIADKILALSNRSTSLADSGNDKMNMWDNGSGDPVTIIKEKIKTCFPRPNVMVIPENVFDSLEVHPKIIAYLGEANMTKVVNAENLQKIFRIKKVIISESLVDLKGATAVENESSIDLQSVWGNNVILAHISEEEDEPCAGKTLIVKYEEANKDGFIVSVDKQKKGLLGGEKVQVGFEVQELVVCEESIATIKNVIKKTA